MMLDIINLSLINYSWDYNVIAALFENPLIPDPMTVIWGIITLLFFFGLDIFNPDDDGDEEKKKRRMRLRKWW